MANKTADKPLASIYAQALYEAAAEAGVLEQVATELKTLRDTFVNSPRVERFFVSPTISFAQKRKVVEGALNDFSRVTQNFLLVLADRNRSQLMAGIATAFSEHSNYKAGIAAVEVHSVRKLNDDERARLTAMLAGRLKKRIDLDERIRPELLGGLIVIHGDHMWDASVAHALGQMTDKMENLKLAAIKWTDSGNLTGV